MKTPGRYCTIVENEFDAVLKAEKGWQKTVEANSKEIVYFYEFKKLPGVVLKVYSSLKADDLVARECGEDAIRICCVNNLTKKGLRKSKRINRVPGWESRLRTRIIDMIQDVKQQFSR